MKNLVMDLHRLHGHMRFDLLKLKVKEGSIASSDELRHAIRTATSIVVTDVSNDEGLPKAAPDKSYSPGESVCTDNTGPFRPKFGGHTMLQHYLGRSSGFVLIISMRSASGINAVTNFSEFNQLIRKRQGPVGTIMSDQGSDYTSIEFSALQVSENYAHNGISIST